MKVKYELPATIFGLLFLLIFFAPSAAKAQYDDVSLETFYDELSPYGVWINDPEYGRVWRPDVDQDDFRPYYSNGRWEMTKYGNTWVSDYDWGWAPFHYGRWHHSGRRGWVWVPDTQWGPAWVSWRSGGGHYGWAPLGPGVNINISIGRIPDFYWVFVPQRSIYYSSYPRYDHRRNMGIYRNTVIINNTYVYNRNRYYTGPRADDVRRVTRQHVTIHDVRNNRPSYARNNRPEVNRGSGRSNNAVQSPRPQRPMDNQGRGSVSPRSENTNNGRPDNSNSRGSNSRADNYVNERPANANVSRPTEARIPASSQRTSRTYDNQDRGRQEVQRQRQEITERQPQQSQRPSAPREQRAERPSQGQVSRDNSRQSNADRGGSSGGRAERSSNAGGRPSRVQ